MRPAIHSEGAVARWWRDSVDLVFTSRWTAVQVIAAAVIGVFTTDAWISFWTLVAFIASGFLWTWLRTPFRQRDEARRHAKEAEIEISRRYSEVRHTLQFQNLELGLAEDAAAAARVLSVGIQFKNGGTQVIKYEIEDVTAAFAGEMGSTFYNRGGLIYPGQVSVFWLPTIRLKIDAALSGELSYVALYGHLDDALRYRSKRRVRIEVSGVQAVTRDGKEEKAITSRWFSLEELETINDVVASRQAASQTG